MFDNLKEVIDDLWNDEGDSAELASRSDDLFNLHYFIKKLHERMVIVMPEYPTQECEQEAWGAFYHDFEDMQAKLLDLSNLAMKACKDMEGWRKEAEEQEQTEKDYGTYEDQVRGQFYSTR